MCLVLVSGQMMRLDMSVATETTLCSVLSWWLVFVSVFAMQLQEQNTLLSIRKIHKNELKVEEL